MRWIKTLITTRPWLVFCGLLALSVLASLIDLPAYLAYCSGARSGLLGVFNPLRYLRYLLTPVGFVLQLALHSPLLYLLAAYWYVQRRTPQYR